MSVIQVAVVKGGSGLEKGNLKDIMLKVAIRSTPPPSKSRWELAGAPREACLGGVPSGPRPYPDPVLDRDLQRLVVLPGQLHHPGYRHW